MRGSYQCHSASPSAGLVVSPLCVVCVGGERGERVDGKDSDRKEKQRMMRL